MSPGRSSGTSLCSTQARKAAPLIGPLSTKGAISPAVRNAQTKGVVFQCPQALCPGSARPLKSVPGSGSWPSLPRFRPETPDVRQVGRTVRLPRSAWPELRLHAPARRYAATFFERQAKAGQGFVHRADADADASPRLACAHSHRAWSVWSRWACTCAASAGSWPASFIGTWLRWAPGVSRFDPYPSSTFTSTPSLSYGVQKNALVGADVDLTRSNSHRQQHIDYWAPL